VVELLLEAVAEADIETEGEGIAKQVIRFLV
jgi:hypothetical protein